MKHETKKIPECHTVDQRYATMADCGDHPWNPESMVQTEHKGMGCETPKGAKQYEKQNSDSGGMKGY